MYTSCVPLHARVPSGLPSVLKGASAPTKTDRPTVPFSLLDGSSLLSSSSLSFSLSPSFLFSAPKMGPTCSTVVVL